VTSNGRKEPERVPGKKTGSAELPRFHPRRVGRPPAGARPGRPRRARPGADRRGPPGPAEPLAHGAAGKRRRQRRRARGRL